MTNIWETTNSVLRPPVGPVLFVLSFWRLTFKYLPTRCSKSILPFAKACLMASHRLWMMIRDSGSHPFWRTWARPVPRRSCPQMCQEFKPGVNHCKGSKRLRRTQMDDWTRICRKHIGTMVRFSQRLWPTPKSVFPLMLTIRCLFTVPAGRTLNLAVRVLRVPGLGAQCTAVRGKGGELLRETATDNTPTWSSATASCRSVSLCVCAFAFLCAVS